MDRLDSSRIQIKGLWVKYNNADTNDQNNIKIIKDGRIKIKSIVERIEEDTQASITSLTYHSLLSS